MPIIFNFKICDNASACNGIAVCPQKAISWDEKQRTLVVDNSKCIACCACAKACPVEGAILVAKTKEELKKFEEQIEDYPMTRAELLEERYGAEPTDQNLVTSAANFDDEVLKTNRIAIVEFWNDNSIKCRLESVMYKELIPKEIVLPAIAGRQCLRFRIKKVNADRNPDLTKKYNIKSLPAILVFWKGKIIHRLDGHISVDQKEKLKAEIEQALNKIKQSP
jgi:NAD-dependent dihydropyrimidine dehydrogenase PreA subunit